jgi:hypothetical protein
VGRFRQGGVVAAWRVSSWTGCLVGFVSCVLWLWRLSGEGIFERGGSEARKVEDEFGCKGFG